MPKHRKHGLEEVRASAACPGRKPPFWAVKRPVHPYKSDIQTDSLWETLRALNRPGRAWTVPGRIDKLHPFGQQPWGGKVIFTPPSLFCMENHE